LNNRKLTHELSHLDIAELESARHHAHAIGLELNSHVCFTPYVDVDDIPTPLDVAATFRRFLKHLGIWVPRHTGRRFTYVRVVHTAEDGSGRNPHLHVFMHLPTAQHRALLQEALSKVHGTDARGGLVAAVHVGSEQLTKHPSGYYGSTLDYMTRHKSQKAYFRQRGRTWRASTRDENGRHRGIKTPFVGSRWGTSRNINAQAREAYDDARRRAVISAQRQRVA
jgi:hypothetical protein